MSNNTNKPTHRAYAVTKNGERSFWHSIGAAWAHGDGQGFTLKLDLLPLNGADMVIRTPQSEQDAARGTTEAAEHSTAQA
jgi:hypothetical protein